MMKKIIQPQTSIRKVYGQNNATTITAINNSQNELQQTTVRKINSLLSSGAVSVTGPTQQRLIRQKPSEIQQTTTIKYATSQAHCYVCDEEIHEGQGTNFTEYATKTTNIKLPTKIARLVGDAFMVIVSADDQVCKRCVTMFNSLDRLESDLEKLKSNIMGCLNKKYGITNDTDAAVSAVQQLSSVTVSTITPSITVQQHQQQPTHLHTQTVISPATITKLPPSTTLTQNVSIQPTPAKLQKLNTGQAYNIRKPITSNGSEDDHQTTQIITSTPTSSIHQPIISNSVNRKMPVMPTLQAIQPTNQHKQHQSLESQLNSLFDTNQIGTITLQTIDQSNQMLPASTTLQQIRPNTTITQVIQKKSPQPTKLYKCVSCEFKTTDLKEFQPHYQTCKQNNYRCKLCKKVFTTMAALKIHNAEKHGSEFQCNICSINYLSEFQYIKHMETNHPNIKIEKQNNVTLPTGTQVISHLYGCNICHFKTPDKSTYDEHMKKHVKVKPFKCRICASRFETREQAAVHAKTHQPDYFKCGKCSMSFPQREQLIKHFDVHKQTPVVNQNTLQPQTIHLTQTLQQIQHPIQQQQQQQQQTVHIQTSSATGGGGGMVNTTASGLTTQKLLQDTIDEALRDSTELDSKIHFFSCNVCSLTFIQENYYNQHMETHKRDTNKKHIVTNVTQNVIRQEQVRSSTTSNNNTTIMTTNTSSGGGGGVGGGSTSGGGGGGGNIGNNNNNNSQMTEVDLESMFEKLHSDKPDSDNNENMIKQNKIVQMDTSSSITSVGIDMPVLDQNDDMEQHHQQQQQQQQQNQLQQLQSGQSISSGGGGGGGPVSMPSLDDDGDSSQPSNNDQIPMDLDELQQAADSGQIKFILNENGQIIQLDNHIITTDADGNQILVQGADNEQIQQLLQSVVLQGDGNGESFQMIQGDNDQMILVQGNNNETQLINASMLNDGQLVLQHHDGNELPEGMHVVNEHGVQVPVSISFAPNTDEDGGDTMMQLQQQNDQHKDHNMDEHHHHQQQQQQEENDGQHQEEQEEEEVEHHQQQQQQQQQQHDGKGMGEQQTDYEDELDKHLQEQIHQVEHDDGEESNQQQQQHQLPQIEMEEETGTEMQESNITTEHHQHDGGDDDDNAADKQNMSESLNGNGNGQKTNATQQSLSESGNNDVFFSLDDLMQQSDSKCTTATTASTTTVSTTTNPIASTTATTTTTSEQQQITEETTDTN